MLVSIEGIDGSGKSTLAMLLAQRLRCQGISALVVPPGGPSYSPTCEAIRSITRDIESRLTNHAEFLLYAARLSHRVEEVIRPALDAGKTVIADRYTHSIFALSHFYRGLRRECVDSVLAEVVNGCEPDGVIFCDINPHVAREREAGRGRPSTRKEALGIGFQETVARGFRTLASEDPDKWGVIQVEDLPPDSVADCALQFVEALRLRQ